MIPGPCTCATADATCGAPDGDVTSWTLMGNVIYDILPDAILNPFIGAGIGVNVHYIPIHFQPYYRVLGFSPGQFPFSRGL